MTVMETLREPAPVKLTATAFFHLADSGAFRNYAKTEPIEGVIVAMNARYSTHARVKTLLLRRIADVVDACMPGFEAWAEVSVALGDDSVPEPDIVVTSFRAAERAAVPAETVALVVEVADTTQRYDLGQKAALYAGAAIPEYWVVDVVAGAIHQMCRPVGDAYTERREVSLRGPITAASDGLG